MNRHLIAALVSVAAASAPSLSTASEATIKHRQGIMDAMGGHLSAIFNSLKNPDAAGDWNFHAQSIARLAEISTATFPEGSEKGKTEALPEVWEKPEEFKAEMDKLVERSKALAAATGEGDLKTIVDSAKKLGGSCKSCHDDFKES